MVHMRLKDCAKGRRRGQRRNLNEARRKEATYSIASEAKGFLEKWCLVGCTGSDESCVLAGNAVDDRTKLGDFVVGFELLSTGHAGRVLDVRDDERVEKVLGSCVL